MQAMAELGDVPVELDLFGPRACADAQTLTVIAQAAARGSRVRYGGAIRDCDVVRELQAYDVRCGSKPGS